MPPARAALTVLLALAASLPGCGAPPEPPWDGTYVPRDELGDWVDRGPLDDACTVLEAGEAACGSLESFDLTACPRRTLSKLERPGVYRAELRPTTQQPVVRGGGFKLGPHGAPERVMGTSLVTGRWDSQTLFFSGRSDDGTTLYSFAGCTAPGPRTVKGCFSVCKDGRLEEAGTFRAERMAWFEGEGYASGGLQRLGESPVELGTPLDVHVVGTHAYVVSERTGKRPGGLTVFDVSESLAPYAVGRIIMPEGSDWRSVTSAEGVLYIASGSTGVAVIDISNPARPTFLHNLPGGALHVSNVRTEADRLYATVVSPQPGTRVFDISTPASPRLLHEVSQSRAGGALPLSGRSADWYEGLLYVNHRHEGFKVVDVSDGTHVQLLGTYRYPYGSSHSSAVATFAGRTIAFEMGQGPGARLRVLDVTDPTRIVKMAEYSRRDVVYPGSLELRGTRLYLAYHHEGVRVLNVSNPTQPREVAWFNTFRETDPGRGDSPLEGAAGLHVPGDGKVYVVDTARGLIILTEPP